MHVSESCVAYVDDKMWNYDVRRWVVDEKRRRRWRRVGPLISSSLFYAKPSS